MTRPTRLILASAALAAAVTTAPAQPLQLPGAQPFNAPGTQQAAPSQPGAPAAPKPPSMPAIKVAGEDAILGKALHRHGHHGEAVFSKTATGYGLKLNLDGFQSTNLVDPCAVSFGDAPLAVTALGRPAGVPRYKLEAPICPIVFDVLDGAFLVVEPTEPCIVQAAQCRIDPRGLWGPDARLVAGQAKEIEKARGSAEREMICRDFQREGQFGFCGARITEARAASLRARLGLNTEPKPAATKPKPRPAAPKPLSLTPTQ